MSTHKKVVNAGLVITKVKTKGREKKYKKKLPNKLKRKQPHRVTLDCLGIPEDSKIGKLTFSEPQIAGWDGHT